jgi:hypothetical protein
MSVPSAVILPPNLLAEDELINDALKFTEGISCGFHEELEAMRHCSLSYVQRWSFLIMEALSYICIKPKEVTSFEYDPR